MKAHGGWRTTKPLQSLLHPAQDAVHEQSKIQELQYLEKVN